MNVNRLFLLMLAVLLLAGCNKTEPAPPAAVPQPVVKAPPPPPPVPTAPAAPKVAQQSPPAAPQGELKKAETGVGAKGRGYGRGVVATPMASYWAMREKIALTIQIPEAMKLFKAIEGRAPESHEEYMEKIIKANNINLPQLPEDERYLYDPQTEQLMVLQPAPQE